MTAIITLLTDFGTADGYAAELKGTLLRLAVGVTVVDLAHDIPPGDVAAAAYAIGRSWRAFPSGTVHCCVVDPGVGTSRRALAGEAEGQRFVGPDNGLFSQVLTTASAAFVELWPVRSASATFHGRDVFAPAAAKLALGARLEDLGARVTNPLLLRSPMLLHDGSDVVGEVVHVDRFGTLVTNLPAGLGPRGEVRIGTVWLPLRATFADVKPGQPVAFIGSGGTVEVAARDARAEAVLGLGLGAEVRWRVVAGPAG
jgi:S-adenosylmethionine hydrolase